MESDADSNVEGESPEKNSESASILDKEQEEPGSWSPQAIPDFTPMVFKTRPSHYAIPIQRKDPIAGFVEDSEISLEIEIPPGTHIQNMYEDTTRDNFF